MEELKRLKLRPVGDEANPNSGSSRWSVSAIVMLGEAELEGDQRAPAHCQFSPLFQERFTEAKADGDLIFVRDGALMVSSGSSAVIDLDLSLAQENLIRDDSLHGARRLVVLLKRPGDQSRFNVHLAAQTVVHSRLYNVQQYILRHPIADLSVNALARIAAMSVRNFTRVFTQEVGVSPSDYVDMARIDVARFLLEGTRMSIDSIAAKSGFGSSRSMRRAFRAHVGATPTDYRERCRTSGEGALLNLSDID
ncbi:helix-turn-helix domain-containing protein [Mesorhizobium sp. CAU 1741]|uniref:GlxA family transcriptional regulator n=1 Tax=Mesorhizobium sp. CAU 1741 TaxID=3140366 RepID=UPI00325BCF1D